MRRRALTGGLVLLLWLGGLGLLVRREYFHPNLDQLAEAALRVTPGAVFYGVMQGDRQIGFASSTIDTARTTVSMDDYLVADMPVGGSLHRTTARTHAVLSRGLRVREFTISLEADAGSVNATGRVFGDSLLVLAIASGQSSADTQRVRLSGPILLPTIVPLAVALGEQPKVGKRYVLPVFDPTSMSPKDIGFVVKAESLFVVNDSSVYDSTSGRWAGVLPDSLHAWQVAADGNGFSGWIDDEGRVVATTQLGLRLRRLPYEVAYENWRMVSIARGGDAPEGRDILESTAIASNKRLSGTAKLLRLRLRDVDLRGFDLAGPRQTLHGDTLTITTEAPAVMRASYALPMGGRRLLPSETRPEPLVQSAAPEIVALARRLAGRESDPRVVAQRIERWVHDSVRNTATFGIPSALQVLHARSGDCNEHTQLYVALARAAGIPARVAAGLTYVDGKFYYHAWPEVFLGGWVAVDPTFGQFPADASHLRFTVGGLGRQTELLRLMGTLRIDVLHS